MPATCRFGWHDWIFWEDVGVAPYFKSNLFKVVQERTCTCCGRKQRRFGGWATMVETNTEYRAASVQN